MKKTGLALEFYKSSFPYLRQPIGMGALTGVYANIANLFLSKKQIDSSLVYARMSLSTAKATQNPQYELDAIISLSKVFEMRNQIDSAFKYQSMIIILKDSLFNAEKIRSVQNMALNERIYEQEIAEARARAVEERKENLQWLALAVFIVTTFIISLLLSRIRIKPKYVETVGLLALLLFFEFVDLFIHPYIEKFTNNSPVWMLIIVAVIASIIAPAHHRLIEWVKQKSGRIFIKTTSNETATKTTSDI